MPFILTCRKKKNFTNEERDTFLHLIKKEKVVYSTKTEAAGSSAERLKDEAWVRIADEFNNFEGFTKVSVCFESEFVAAYFRVYCEDIMIWCLW